MLFLGFEESKWQSLRIFLERTDKFVLEARRNARGGIVGDIAVDDVILDFESTSNSCPKPIIIDSFPFRCSFEALRLLEYCGFMHESAEGMRKQFAIRTESSAKSHQGGPSDELLNHLGLKKSNT